MKLKQAEELNPRLDSFEEAPIIPPPASFHVPSPRVILYDAKGKGLVRKIGF